MSRTESDLRKAISLVQRRKPKRGRRYPAELRARIVAHARAGQAVGISIRAVAAALDLSYQTLLGWVTPAEKTRPARRFRSVAVRGTEAHADDAESSGREGFRLVTAQGHRVEGLSREDLVQILRALA